MLRSETARNFLHSGGVRTATSESIFQLSAGESWEHLSRSAGLGTPHRIRETESAVLVRGVTVEATENPPPEEAEIPNEQGVQGCVGLRPEAAIGGIVRKRAVRVVARTISGQEGRLGFLVSVGKAHYLQPKTLKGGNRDNGGIWRYLICMLVLFHGDRRVRRYQTDCQAEGRICIGPGDEPVKRVKKCAGTDSVQQNCPPQRGNETLAQRVCHDPGFGHGQGIPPGIGKEMRREWLQIGRRHWQPGRQPTNVPDRVCKPHQRF
ncbi:hypothetical protein B0H14DRAFT_3137871 [Mycena olivaceomarginata]|nr:hypothetical protein B0H14DRAFT_3137871 [Mycena olivaceomarginata]